MARDNSVSENVKRIISTFFNDGCYVYQVVEKYIETQPQLTVKQARIKVDKSMRFQEKKGVLQSKLDEGGTRRYTLSTSLEQIPLPNRSRPTLKTIQSLREQCKRFKAEAHATHIEWQYLIELKKNPELSEVAQALAKDAEQKTLELTSKFSALEKLLGRIDL